MAENIAISKLRECWKDIDEKAGRLYRMIMYPGTRVLRTSDEVQYSFQKIGDGLLSDTAGVDIDYYCNAKNLSDLFYELEEGLESLYGGMENRSCLIDFTDTMYHCERVMQDIRREIDRIKMMVLTRKAEMGSVLDQIEPDHVYEIWKQLSELMTQLGSRMPLLEQKYDQVLQGAKSLYERVRGSGSWIIRKNDDGFGGFGLDPKYVDRLLQEYIDVCSSMGRMIVELMDETRFFYEKTSEAVKMIEDAPQEPGFRDDMSDAERREGPTPEVHRETTAEVPPATDNNQPATANKMKAAIAAVYENEEDVERILEVLRLLKEGVFWVPVAIRLSPEDQEMFLNAAKGDSISLNSDVRMRPDYLRNADGLLYFPAFTDQEETEEAYRYRFSWIQIPGKDIIDATISNSSLAGVVINGFSQTFTVNRELLDFLNQGHIDQHTIEKGAIITLERLGDAEKGMRKIAADFLFWKHSVKKAFFARMYVDGKEESYCLVVDGDIQDPQSTFTELNEKIQKAKPDLPVDYVLYPSMAVQLRNCGIEPFYIKDGCEKNRERVAMEPTGLFFLSVFTDDEGWNLGASFDFEKAEDSHYSISGEEAAKLAEYLRKDLNSEETNLVMLVHDYLGNVLNRPDAIEAGVKYMLNKFKIDVKEFHFY